MSSPMYDVYRVEYRLGMHDNMMGPGTRYHNVIFVATDPDGGGRILQVEGGIGETNGMRFREKPGKRPEESDTYVQKHYLGKIMASDYANVVQLLQTIPPPPRQRNFNKHTMATEQCKPDGTFYLPNEPRPPYMKCTEWTLLKALPALQQSGLLRNGINPQPSVELIPQPTPLQPSQPGQGWVWDEGRQTHRRWDGSAWVYNTPQQNPEPITQQTPQQSVDWVWDEGQNKYRRWNGTAWVYQ